MFFVMPTGFGKSAILVVPSLVLNKVYGGNHIALVIMSLRAIIKDQMRRWRAAGVQCAALMQKKEMLVTDVDDIMAGKCTVLFASPESLFVEPWYTMLREQRKKFCVVALDEVHCMTDWGDTFRPQYQKVGRLRGILTGVPIAAVTATMTAKMQSKVFDALHLKATDFCHIAVVPDRPNIRLILDRCGEQTIPNKLAAYASEIKEEGKSARKCVIFARSIDCVMELLGYFWDMLGDSFYCEGEAAEVFHRKVDPVPEEEVPQKFSEDEGYPRCVISTVAFGMGINITNIDLVFHWGPPQNVLLYWQEVGGCARDGRTGTAVMFTPPYSVNSKFVEEDLMEVLRRKQADAQLGCLRKHMLEELRVEGIEDGDIEKACGGPGCCSVFNAVLKTY